MEKQLSIIIPTYNMEKYIGKCLDSLLIPELDQVEVLVVNDGSKDRSSAIAHSYADRFPDSIRVIDKTNGNYGSCINTALPLCTGRYVKILDADDTFDTTVFSQFVKLLPGYDEDVLITAFSIVDENGQTKKVTEFDKYFVGASSGVQTFEDAMKSALFNEPQMHSIAYNRNIFQRFNYHQTEGISFTDTEWASQPLAFCENVRLVNVGVLYKYLMGREGQTVDPSRFEKQLDNYLKVFDNRLNFIEQQVEKNERRNFLREFLLLNHCYVYSRLYSSHSQSIISAIIDYESKLRVRHPDFYDYLGEKGRFPMSNYRFIKKWRKESYKSPMSLPLITKSLISLRCRLSK